jgi:hypothetical protein
MFARKFVVMAGCIALLGTLMQTPTGAAPPSGLMYLTFSGSVQLPGVTLAAGSYVFELIDPYPTNVVRVRGRHDARTLWLGMTRRVDRPANLTGDRAIVFGETPAGTPPPIKIWYPSDESTGRQFIY